MVDTSAIETVEVGGQAVPRHYGSAADEYEAAHRGAVVIRRSHEGRLRVTGRDRLDLLHRELPGADLASFRFKALRPTFDGQTMQVNGQPQADGKTVKLWAQDHAGWLTMDAVATLR